MSDNNLISDLVSGAQGTDQDTVESAGLQFPIIQWHYGNKKSKKLGGFDYTGGWFINDTAYDMTGIEGWTPTSWTHDNGTETDGFYASQLTLTTIHSRKRWEVTVGERRVTYDWHGYDEAKKFGNPKGRTQYLVTLKGIPDQLFVVTLRGYSAMMFSDRQQGGVLQRLNATVVTAATNQMRKAGVAKKLPYRAFWFTVGYNRQTNTTSGIVDGFPIFTEVGSGTAKSNVVLPVVLGLPDKPEQVVLTDFYIGQETLARHNQYHTDNLAWATAWDNIAPGSEADERMVAKHVENPDPETMFNNLAELGI